MSLRVLDTTPFHELFVKRPSAMYKHSSCALYEELAEHGSFTKSFRNSFYEALTEDSDAASIGTPPPIRMVTEKGQIEEPHLGNKKPKLSVMERTFSADSAVVRTAAGVKEYFKDYCMVTAIHGVRYFAEDGRYRIEKIFWVVALTLSMMFCFHLILKVYEKWDSSPVIVSFAESSTSIWQVPFPAVSICPETKSCQTKFNFTEKYYIHLDYQKLMANNTNSTMDADFSNVTMLNDEERSRMEAVSLLCDKHVLTTGSMHMTEEDIEDLKNLAPQFLEMMLVCRWQGQIINNCSHLFKPVWSDEGICFTFNMLDTSELFTKAAVQYADVDSKIVSGWDLEHGYPNDGKMDTFPNRALGAGAMAGLFILLQANETDLDFLCRGPVQGFKILLHNPAEIPRIGQQYFRVPLNQEIIAAVKPSMMTTSPGLHSYPPHRRQCYFPRERQLRFFQVYTQKNCELECITNFTLKRCGCVAFYMPRDNETAICGPGSTNCTVNAFEESVREEISNDLERIVKGESPNSQTTECDCLASCISLEYDAETSQADYNWRNVFMAYRTPLNELGPGLILSRISIFFKDIQFITSHRSELYGPTDFLANCGGLLGLFSGFSFLSLVEIFYFLTLRLWCRLEKRRRNRTASKDISAYSPEKSG